MDKVKRPDPKKAHRRPLAWLTVLAGIPVLILLTVAWVHLCIWLLSLIRHHLSGFLEDLLGDIAGELSITSIATAVIISLSGTTFAKMAEKLYPTRRGWRYFFVAACSFVLAGLFAYWLIQERLPFRLPYQPDAVVMFNVILALCIYGVSVIRAVFSMRAKREELSRPPEHITVICYTEKPREHHPCVPDPTRKGLIPLCFITGGTPLVNETRGVEIPIRAGMKLDREQLDRIVQTVCREEQFNERFKWKTLNVFDGEYVTVTDEIARNEFIVTMTVACRDMIRIYSDKIEQDYVDLLNSPLFDKKLAGFDRVLSIGDHLLESQGSLASCRQYIFDENGELAPAGAKTPEKKRKSLQARLKDMARKRKAKHSAPAKTETKPTAPAAKAAAPTSKPAAPAAKAAPTPVATARKAMTEPERKALIQSIYGRDYGAIWAAIDKLKLPIQNICDIEDGKLSDEALRALEDALRQTPKQEAKKTSTQTTKQTPTTTPKQTPKQTSTPKELLADGEKRIYIVMDSSLTEAERNAVARAVEDTRQVFPSCSLELTGQGKSAAAEGIRKNMDTYLEGTRQENGRCDADQILRRLESLAQYKKEAAAILLLTGQDLCLNSQGASWCFGAGNRARHTAVCSLYRYQELTAPERLRCVRRTLRHEIGHALGLAMDPKRTNTEKHFGVHCTAPGCSMRQTENLLKLLRFSREEEQQGKWFCPDCLADLKKALSKAGKRE